MTILKGRSYFLNYNQSAVVLCCVRHGFILSRKNIIKMTTSHLADTVTLDQY